jgi:hypothetical protein
MIRYIHIYLTDCSCNVLFCAFIFHCDVLNVVVATLLHIYIYTNTSIPVPTGWWLWTNYIHDVLDLYDDDLEITDDPDLHDDLDLVMTLTLPMTWCWLIWIIIYFGNVEQSNTYFELYYCMLSTFVHHEWILTCRCTAWILPSVPHKTRLRGTGSIHLPPQPCVWCNDINNTTFDIHLKRVLNMWTKIPRNFKYIYKLFVL